MHVFNLRLNYFPIHRSVNLDVTLKSKHCSIPCCLPLVSSVPSTHAPRTLKHLATKPWSAKPENKLERISKAGTSKRSKQAKKKANKKKTTGKPWPYVGIRLSFTFHCLNHVWKKFDPDRDRGHVHGWRKNGTCSWELLLENYALRPSRVVTTLQDCHDFARIVEKPIFGVAWRFWIRAIRIDHLSQYCPQR